MSGFEMISRRKCIFSVITGMIAAFCYVAGYRLDTFDTLDFLDKRFYLLWVIAATLAAIAIYLLWQGLDRLAAWAEKTGTAETGNGRGGWLLCTALLFLCWLPALLSLFPGAFSYDALDEWKQVQQWSLTSHHPVAHVLFLGGLVEGFFHLTGSYNVGIAVYSVLQMLVLAGVFASVIHFMKEFGLPRAWRIASLLFYGFSPVVQLFSICATKDVLFTGAELIFFLYTIRLAVNRELQADRRKMILYGLSALCTMILRNNGVYIVLLTLAVFAFASGKSRKKYQKNRILFLLVILIPYLLYTGPVYRALDVEAGGVEEMLSVPLQQMARVYRYDQDSLEGKDLEVLYRYVDREALEKYRATVADFVKKGFHRETFAQDKAEFFKLWAKWGGSHPLTYSNSFFVNTVDAWYPGAVIDGYRHADGRGSYFDYKVDSPGTEIIYLQKLHDYYETLSHDVQAQKKPLAFLVLSPGWYFLCTLILFFYFWSRRKYRLLLPFFVFIFHFLTVLLGPMILDVGIYFFSQAVTEEEALEEADFVIENLKTYPINYPVVIDIEDVDSENARTNDLTAEERTKFVITFCDRIREAGYTPMIYGNLQTFMLMLDIEQLEDYEKWFAYYSKEEFYYPYDFSVWQYSDSGKIDGIGKKVDLNISFKEW